METAVTSLRELWRKRGVVALLAVVAIAVGALVAYRPSLPPESRKYDVGVANARILVDTPASQAVEVAPKGSETLGARTSLLANLMAEGEVKAVIAKRAGLDPDQLQAVAPSGTGSDADASADPSNPRGSILTTRALTNDAGEQLPIISVDTQAADARRAAALADAAVAGLAEYLDSTAAADRVPDARRLRVRTLGAAQAREETRGPGPLIAIAAAMFIFAVLCGLLLFWGSLVRGWRTASDVEDDFRAAAANGTWHVEPRLYDGESATSQRENDDSVEVRAGTS